jgi:hypothetical protein
MESSNTYEIIQLKHSRLEHFFKKLKARITQLSPTPIIFCYLAAIDVNVQCIFCTQYEEPTAYRLFEF